MKYFLSQCRSRALYLVMIVLSLGACTHDNVEDLFGIDTCDTSAVSYAAFVEPVVSQNCYVCHATVTSLGGVAIEGYDGINVYVDNERLLGAIRRLDGFSPMPQDALQLDDCTLDKIEAWINAGAPDN